MRILRTVLPIAALALAGCEFFGSTTVPATDTQAPWGVVALYFDGDHEEIRVGDRTLPDSVNILAFDYVTSDVNKIFYALAAGVDGGGVREVTLTSRLYYRCLWGDTSNQIIEPWGSITVDQDGSVGDTVDNGLYVPKFFRARNYLSSIGSCDSGGYRIILEWYSTTEDFHGNLTHYGLARLQYIEWGD